MYTIELHKRGLPHVHMLVWLEHKISQDQVDRIISAEIPNAETDPILYGMVKKFMVHGPCGLLNQNCPCMVVGKCSKYFPKTFNDFTTTSDNGYPKYRRRDLGQTVVTSNGA